MKILGKENIWGVGEVAKREYSGFERILSFEDTKRRGHFWRVCRMGSHWIKVVPNEARKAIVRNPKWKSAK